MGTLKSKIMKDFQISNIIYDKSFREPTDEERQEIFLLLDILYPYRAADTIVSICRQNGIINDKHVEKVYEYLEDPKMRSSLDFKFVLWETQGVNIQKELISMGFYYPISWIKELYFNKKRIILAKKKTNYDSKLKQFDLDWENYYKQLDI